ncbi:TPA: methionine--tRNA ligase [Candidatus Woesearchaeota archaeon]|nr:methionine--tRNA ligase [Candidatus Woesearchaeota archaeon]HIH32472.1 methionine--tRNA ligase [Candidatus Woesearchaeota archaeon]HIH54257.1 methionine--tRNA ligase [Candidatus Woesearchaeota archaeon]HIJ02595.1 methionine--tRNA ligase [Candidatus Woesearchaeota archaeon]HIJ13858.1 methionine--tRNA ligase [Candidatus Woesearchaeota archaeon]
MVKFIENKKDKIVLTNALIYANGPVHIGHLVEYIQADTISRILKLLGHEVIFCGAEDTHGAPIEIKASQLGIAPEELIRKVAEEHQKDFKDYNIKYDSYYSTNSKENQQLAELIFSRLRAKNLIYKKTMELTFCEHCKRFLPDRYVKGQCPKCNAEDQYGDQCEKCGTAYKTTDLVNPYCSICKNTPIRKDSDHYFFRLNEFSEKLREWLTNNQELQSEIRNQIINWIDKGLDDWCVSRDGPYFGFKIPGEENKYFYVWLDAPIGYISSLSYKQGSVEKGLDYWNNSKIIHIIGKDIVYFHLLFWPAVLMGADIKLPSNILVHGFLNVNNEKMSKSRGTFLNASEFTQLSKPEYFRYYIASNLSRTMSDINLDLEDFKERINNELVSNIANFAYRILSFTNKNFNNQITSGSDDVVLTEAKAIAREAMEYYEKFELRNALKSISRLSALGNKYFQENEPWKLIKNDKEKAQHVINTAINILKDLILTLKPVLPEYTSNIETQLNVNELTLKDLDHKLHNHQINQAGIIFEKIEKIEIGDNDKKSAFDKLQLRVAKVIRVEKHPKAEKLYIEQIDLGDEKRQIVSGLVPYYTEEELLNKNIIVVTNLGPATLRNIESNGMLLAAEEKGIVGLLFTDAEPGAYVYIDEKNIEEIKKLPRITLKEFSEAKLIAKDGKVYTENKELKINNGLIKIDKISNGSVH